MATSTYNGRQFRSIFDKVITYQAAYDPGNAATGSGTFASSDINVPGVALGDFALCTFSLDSTDAVITAQVTAANTVTVTLLNNTAGAVNLSPGVIRIVVLRPSAQLFYT
jgi:hypothetical protein